MLDLHIYIYFFFLSNFQSKLKKGGCYVNVHYIQQWHNGIKTVTLEDGYVKENVNLEK